eukprot:PhM_4_TR14427/c0_g2_i1/m.24274
MRVPQCCGAKTVPLTLHALGIVGAVAAGLYTTDKLMWDHGSLRWAIMYTYLIAFSFVVIVAELGFLQANVFRTYAMFLTTYTGRGIFYIFFGGLLLKGWGLVVGIYLMVVGGVNICSVCCLSEHLKAEHQRVPSESQPPTPGPTAI